MKKLIYFSVILASIFCFNCVVNAENAVYEEGSWAAVSNDNCGSYNEVVNSYTGYSFDKNTGLFSLTGETYSQSQSSSVKKYVFYTTSSDKKTLYAYIPSYNSNVSFISSSLNIPAGNCDATYKVSKTSSLSSSSTTGGNTTNSGQTGDTNTNDSTTNNEENLQDELYSGDEDNQIISEPDQTVQSDTNPNTGLSDYALFLVPLAIIIGAIIVLKKKKLLNTK